jgi:hypothetical protein
LGGLKEIWGGKFYGELFLFTENLIFILILKKGGDTFFFGKFTLSNFLGSWI